MPVCSNCGGSDFVWAENLRTGTIGRGTLSLRSGGELAFGTRVCRGCGHADLFVKDPTILRQPHTWKPGEFVPIPARAPTGDPRLAPAAAPPPRPVPMAPPASPMPVTPLPPPTAPPMAPPAVRPVPPAEVPAGSGSPPSTTPVPPPSEDGTRGATEASPETPSTGAEPVPPARGGKRPSRRKVAKVKPGSSSDD